MACNGNGHISGKRNAHGVSLTHSDGHADDEGQEMEVYIPMLTQIPPDFKSPPLDTKTVLACIVHPFGYEYRYLTQKEDIWH
ncbi:hypothetical protein SK128_012402 [Halocaridina rubra]|uniref:Uncharacterized protein n=1 Tax=Halocaridina rubra TaxID=373956 RepID=A0AAN8WXU6_HALRR